VCAARQGRRLSRVLDPGNLFAFGIHTAKIQVILPFQFSHVFEAGFPFSCGSGDEVIERPARGVVSRPNG